MINVLNPYFFYLDCPLRLDFSRALRFQYAFFWQEHNSSGFVCQNWLRKQMITALFKWLSNGFLLIPPSYFYIEGGGYDSGSNFSAVFFSRGEKYFRAMSVKITCVHLCPVPLLKTQPSWQVENENVHTPTPRNRALSARWQVNMKRGKSRSWIWKRLVNLSDVCQQC